MPQNAASRHQAPFQASILGLPSSVAHIESEELTCRKRRPSALRLSLETKRIMRGESGGLQPDRRDLREVGVRVSKWSGAGRVGFPGRGSGSWSSHCLFVNFGACPSLVSPGLLH
jgi:hypothetical protein